MKKALLLVTGGAISIIVGMIAVFSAAIAIVRLLSAKRRGQLARLPGAMMGWMMEHMPDE